MRFCPECENFLVPLKGALYCRTCEKSYKLSSEDKNNYVIIKNLANDDMEPKIISKKASENIKISKEDREAYEDYFKLNT